MNKINIRPRVEVKKDIIIAEALGEQNEANAEYLFHCLEKEINRLRAAGIKPKVLLDVSRLKLNKSTSGAREAYRKMTRLDYSYAAVVSKGGISLLANYIVRTIGKSDNVSFHASKKAALEAISNQPIISHDTRSYSTLSGLGGYILILVGAVTLSGFIFNLSIFTTFIPEGRPINPLAAIALILLGIASLRLITPVAKKGITITHLLLVVSAAFSLIGVTGINLSFLFPGHDFNASDVGYRFAAPGVVAIILLNIGLFLRSRQKKPRLDKRVFTIDIAVAVISIVSLYSILYSHLFTQLQPSALFMAAPLSLALFFAAGFNVIRYVNYRYVIFNNSLSNRNLNYVILVVVVSLQIILYVFLVSAENRTQLNQQEAVKNRADRIENQINDRIRVYQDALRGYSALYLSSNEVTEAEFQSFTDGTDIANQYPGFLVISYIQRVEDSKLSSFVADRKMDTSFDASAARKFTIPNISDQPVHYIYNFASNPPRDNLGFDLSTIPSRLKTFEKAEKTKQQVASSTVDFNVSGENENLGFFITVPVYSPADSDVPVGFVNAVLPYQRLMPSLFKNSELLKGVQLQINDGENNIYSSSSSQKPYPLKSTFVLKIADSTWDVKVAADQTFGLTEAEKNSPMLIFLIGQIVTISIIAIFVYQGFARSRMLLLAQDINQDLSNEKEKALIEKSRVDTILNNVGEALVTVNVDGIISYVNPSFSRVTGFELEDVKNNKLTDTLPLLDENSKPTDSNNHIWSALLSTKKAQTITSSDNYWYRAKNGSLFPVSLSLAPIIKNGVVVGAVETFRNIAKEKEVDKAKTEFVSLASHQLRTPLSTINWYSEMLLSGDAGKMNDEQKSYLEEIYNGNHRMTELIGSLLNVSRIDLGTFSIDPVPTDIVALAKDVVKDLEPKIFKRLIKFDEHYSSDVPKLNVDPKIMRMIIENLASNAVKYTPEKGSVDMTIKTSGKKLLIEVTDTGFGIPKAQQHKIFSKLFRADNVKARDTEGTGLGLYLVKYLVEYSEGTISFVSKEDKGTTFTVELPIKGMKEKKGTKKLD